MGKNHRRERLRWHAGEHFLQSCELHNTHETTDTNPRWSQWWIKVSKNASKSLSQYFPIGQPKIGIKSILIINVSIAISNLSLINSNFDPSLSAVFKGSEDYEQQWESITRKLDSSSANMTELDDFPRYGDHDACGPGDEGKPYCCCYDLANDWYSP